MARVLVVEDDAHIRDLIVLHLGLEGLDAEAVGDGQAALVRANTTAFDLIILDLMLPGVDGLAICRAVRREGPNQDVPILMLTARREESDKVLGLESGADDYLSKPFGIRELVARVRALLRRAQPEKAAGRIEAGDLRIDTLAREATFRERPLTLTPREFDLLAFFATRPGRVFSRDELLRKVWGYDYLGETRTVDVHVRRLRMKLGERNRVIHTVTGAGYKLVPPSRGS